MNSAKSIYKTRSIALSNLNPKKLNVNYFSVDCKWGDYGTWTSCSKTCGGGEKTRSRTKATEASNGGQECQGEANETDACNTDACANLVSS